MRKYKMMSDGRWWSREALRVMRKHGRKANIRSTWSQAGGFAVPVVDFDRWGKKPKDKGDY